MTAADSAGAQSDRPLAIEEMARRSFEELSETELDHILDPREQKILRLKWGIEDGREYNNREVGLELRLGDERVRQVFALAVQKLVDDSAKGRAAGDG